MDLSRVDLVLCIVAIAEACGFAVFAIDKRRARLGLWRTPESTLLVWALIGGLGAWLGQHMLRHKTRKEPFRSRLGRRIALHLALLVAASAFSIASSL